MGTFRHIAANDVMSQIGSENNLWHLFWSFYTGHQLFIELIGIFPEPEMTTELYPYNA